MHIVLKNGTRIPVKATTINTYWESGRKDCRIIIEEPLNSSSRASIGV
jgi:hypothetical protein